MKAPPAQYPWADYPSNDKWTNKELADKYKFELLAGQGREAAGRARSQGAPAANACTRASRSASRSSRRHRSTGRSTHREAAEDELKRSGSTRPVRSLSAVGARREVQRGEYDIDSYWLCGESSTPSSSTPTGRATQSQEDRRERGRQATSAGSGTRSWTSVRRSSAQLDPTSAEAKPLLTRRWRPTSRSCR